MDDFNTQWNTSWKSLVFDHVFITNDKIALKLHIQRLLKRSLTWFINESINNDQEKHFKLQTNKLKSFKIKVLQYIS